MNFQHSITPARTLFDLKLKEIWRYCDLNTASYQCIINGNGYGLKDALPSFKIVKQIREKLVERVIA